MNERVRDPEGLEIKRLSERISEVLVHERLDDCLGALALALATGLLMAYDDPAKRWTAWEETSKWIRARLRRG